MKKVAKKLTLKTSVISKLNEREMGLLIGGDDWYETQTCGCNDGDNQNQDEGGAREKIIESLVTWVATKGLDWIVEHHSSWCVDKEWKRVGYEGSH